MTVESNLESVETDTPEILPFTVFVPDDQAMGMDQVEAELLLNTNDPARVAITELLSGQADGFENINILPEGTTINYLFLNNDNIVEVDVSSEFEENMNAGSTGELFAVYTLVNTLSQYYGAQEVLLTVDGEPYAGAHMALQEGETLAFNEDMVN
jgi:Sporulation and spore germination.